MESTGSLKVTTPSDREIAMTRVFDAPARLVFDAWTKPELIKRWRVIGKWSFLVCEVDLRVGGAYRYVWKGPDGVTMGLGGIFREIVKPERIVATEKFDDPWYAGEAIDTTTFVEESGKTTRTTTVLYVSKEVRDGVLKSPMESGVAKGYDNLAALLAEQK
ncbi:MAG TPA: SRPBCC family protein [Thermoanaerobaculia bacterium]